MSRSEPPVEKRHDLEIYEFRIHGHLHEKRAKFFEGLTIKCEDDGTTTLYGPLPDQTALHSILVKIRNLNMKLISVRQIENLPDEV